MPRLFLTEWQPGLTAWVRLSDTFTKVTMQSTAASPSTAGRESGGAALPQPFWEHAWGFVLPTVFRLGPRSPQRLTEPSSGHGKGFTLEQWTGAKPLKPPGLCTGRRQVTTGPGRQLAQPRLAGMGAGQLQFGAFGGLKWQGQVARSQAPAVSPLSLHRVRADRCTRILGMAELACPVWQRMSQGRCERSHEGLWELTRLWT